LSARVTVYTGPFCGYCNAAKRLLDSKKIPYTAIDLAGQPAERARLVAETGWRTVPIIMVDEELIGGYTELSSAMRKGELSHLADETP
jgi:glutaredoxin 3